MKTQMGDRVILIKFLKNSPRLYHETVKTMI